MSHQLLFFLKIIHIVTFLKLKKARKNGILLFIIYLKPLTKTLSFTSLLLKNKKTPLTFY